MTWKQCAEGSAEPVKHWKDQDKQSWTNLQTEGQWLTPSVMKVCLLANYWSASCLYQEIKLNICSLLGNLDRSKHQGSVFGYFSATWHPVFSRWKTCWYLLHKDRDLIETRTRRAWQRHRPLGELRQLDRPGDVLLWVRPDGTNVAKYSSGLRGEGATNLKTFRFIY